MKKVLILGASYLQTFVINCAKDMGYYTIATDGNENSEGFKCADKYYVCSTTDIEKTLEIAEKEKIDGILTYASDVAAPTAAYVAEKLGLPTNPFESVKIMTDKSLTRKFMQANGFNTPRYSEAESLNAAKQAAEEIGFPVICKPVDSSGSKGVSKVESIDGLSAAFMLATENSRSKRVVIEEFIQKKGHQIDADCFMCDGKLLHFLPMDQHNDRIAPFSPIGISAPSVQSKEKSELAFSEVERFLTLLNMKYGTFNVEYIFDRNDKLYILEIGPRAGGNLIPDVILESAGIDLRKYTVKASMGLDCSDFKSESHKRCVSSYIIHSQTDGVFGGVEYDGRIKVLMEKFFTEKGDRVHKFGGAGDVIGFSLLEFNNINEMNEIMDDVGKYIEVLTEEDRI